MSIVYELTTNVQDLSNEKKTIHTLLHGSYEEEKFLQEVVYLTTVHHLQVGLCIKEIIIMNER